MSDPTAITSHRRAISRRGEQVTFRRISGQAPNAQKFEAAVLAIVQDYVPQGDVMPIKREGGITQGARKIIVLNDDLQRARFPLPLQKNDKALVRGTELNIAWVDPSKRSVGNATEMIVVGV